MTQRDFIDLVAAMRTAQQRLKAGDSSSLTLTKVRHLERQVDRVLEEIVKIQKQGSLFDLIADRREEDMSRVTESQKRGAS